MTHKIAFLPAVLALTACLDTGSSAAVPEWQSTLVGKTLTLEGAGTGVLTMNANGTLTGTLNGQDTSLSWVAENGLFCREGSTGSSPVPRRCQSVEIEGNQARFINPDGLLSTTWTFM